eukprot:3630970-Amphidinium_carterae.1
MMHTELDSSQRDPCQLDIPKLALLRGYCDALGGSHRSNILAHLAPTWMGGSGDFEVVGDVS